MTWPAFDLGEAINQTISAVVTVTGVLLGGWLAFRLGIRQLREGRAIERRVESHEKLLSSVGEYRLSLQVLLLELEKPANGTTEQERLRSAMLTNATERGRELQARIRHAQLYCVPDEKNHLDRVMRSQLMGYVASWTLATNPSTDGKEVAELRSIVADLEADEQALLDRLRTEMSLPSLPRRVAASSNTPAPTPVR